MSDRSAMHCHLHGDYRCTKCFSVFGYDRSVQYVQGLEAQLAAERERVKRLLEALAVIHEITGQPSVAHECISALAATQEITLDDQTQMAFGEKDA